jgi:predicted Kef-type K+ transport protein
LLGGVFVGPYVLGFFSTDRPIADFMAELGKLLLMFFALALVLVTAILGPVLTERFAPRLTAGTSDVSTLQAS